MTPDQLADMARALVRTAEDFGIVLRVEQEPTQPFRMGSYATVVSAWPARELDEPRDTQDPSAEEPRFASPAFGAITRQLLSDRPTRPTAPSHKRK